MNSNILTISIAVLKTMFRQKSIIFSCFLLPLFTLWSTWWVTAEIIMDFPLENGARIASNMINVHVVTGGLTAIAITSGLFGFVLTADSRRIAERLRIMGYSPLTINLGWFFALFGVLLLSAMTTAILVVILYEPVSITGIVVAIVLTTFIYTAFGYLIGIFLPKIMEGTLIVLLVSFIDLMLLSNPMGEAIYLTSWTKVVFGFWPTQIALESAFIGLPEDIIFQSGLVLGYVCILLLVAQLSQYTDRLKSIFQFRKEVRS